MRAPAILLLLAVFGLAGCGATKWATYGGKNPSGVIIGVPLDIVTAPSQIADAVRRGEAQRRQEVLTNKLNASPVIVLDPKVAAVPEDRSTLLRWFDQLDEKTRPSFTEAQWTTLLSPGYPLPLYGLALNKRRDTVVPAKVMAAAVKTGEAPSVNGKKLNLKADGKGVTVNGAKVTAADLVGSNGVIHVVDTVILP